MGYEVFILTSHRANGGPPQPAIQVEASITHWTRACLGGQIAEWVRREGLSLVNLQYQTAAFRMSGAIHLLPQLLRWHGVPFITTFHDLRFPYLFPKAGPLRPWSVRHLARHSTACLTTNRGDLARLQAEVNPRHLAQIPLGPTVKIIPPTDSAQAQALRAQQGVAPDDWLIAHFGFVNASKGVETLIQAIHLAQQGGLKVRLWMLGERLGSSDPTNAAYTAHIEALAQQYAINIHWTGFLSDAELGVYLTAADVVALPFRDGASLRRTSLQAALAYGCAIITTSPTDDPLPEFIHEQHLLYVPADDPSALASALIRLQHDSALAATLGKGAQAAARQFSWESIAQQVLAFYQQVLESIAT
jgi:glycosyltransferase involved in cell wall biosynthesis